MRVWHLEIAIVVEGNLIQNLWSPQNHKDLVLSTVEEVSLRLHLCCNRVRDSSHKRRIMWKVSLLLIRGHLYYTHSASAQRPIKNWPGSTKMNLTPFHYSLETLHYEHRSRQNSLSEPLILLSPTPSFWAPSPLLTHRVKRKSMRYVFPSVALMAVITPPSIYVF